MPLYEYECQACGNQLEVQQRMADAPLTQCPACGEDQLQKIAWKYLIPLSLINIAATAILKVAF